MAKDATSSLVTFGLIGAAGYIAGGFFGFWPLPSFLQSSPAQTFIAPPGMVPAGTSITPFSPTPAGIIPAGTLPPSSSPIAPTVPIVQPPALPPASSRGIATQIVAAMAAVGNTATEQTYDQWNYYYQKVFGTFQQAAPGVETRNTPMTVGEFITNSPGLSSSGISGGNLTGMRGLRGLGAHMMPVGRLRRQSANYVRRRVY